MLVCGKCGKRGEHTSTIGDVFVCPECSAEFRGYKVAGDKKSQVIFLNTIKGRKGCSQNVG